MALGHVGLFTAVLEAVATAVGAGILLVGCVVGSAGILRGWPRTLLDERVLTLGYFGGIAGAGLALVDVILRYGG